MKLRNLPTDQPTKLADLVTHRAGQVASRALISGDGASLTVLSFDAGEDVSEEEYFGDTMYFVVEGRARISLPDRAVEMVAGDCFMVPAHVEHAVENLGEPIKLFQLTVNE